MVRRNINAGYGNSYTIPEAVRDAKALRRTNVNLVNWQPVVGTVQFDGPAVTVGTQRTMFLDELGQSSNSGVSGGLTEADGTFHGGRVPTGQLILLQSFGISIGGGGGTGITAADVFNLISNFSVQMNLRGRPIDMGGIQDWPEINGVSGVPSNGRQIVGEYRFDTPHLLEPQDTFTMRLRCEIATTLSGAGPYLIRGYLGSTRVYDERVLAVS